MKVLKQVILCGVLLLNGGCAIRGIFSPSCQLVYSLWKSVMDDIGADIYMVDCDGENKVQLTDDLGDDFNPDWSPDGNQIVFDSNRDGNWEIYIMNADGSEQRNFSNYPLAIDLNPAWSPDGEWIAFYSDRDGDLEIYIQAVEGGETIQVTDNQYEDIDPTWSPEGDQLAFLQARDEHGVLFELAIVSLDDLSIERVLLDIQPIRRPAWSPDGRWIAFPANVGRHEEIFVVDIETWEYVQLTHVLGDGLTEINGSPSWSPDGSLIIFDSNRKFKGYEIYMMNSEGSEVEVITSVGIVQSSPDWRP
jgi:Tol biopolymer transport system component